MTKEEYAEKCIKLVEYIARDYYELSWQKKCDLYEYYKKKCIQLYEEKSNHS